MKILLLFAIFMMIYPSFSVGLAEKSELLTPKIIWVWFDRKIINDSQNIKFFNFQREFESKGWQVKILNSQNKWIWFSRIPNLNDLLQSEFFKNMTENQQKNLVRFLLIKYFGGIYFDYNTLKNYFLETLNVSDNLLINISHINKNQLNKTRQKIMNYIEAETKKQNKNKKIFSQIQKQEKAIEFFRKIFQQDKSQIQQLKLNIKKIKTKLQQKQIKINEIENQKYQQKQQQYLNKQINNQSISKQSEETENNSNMSYLLKNIYQYIYLIQLFMVFLNIILLAFLIKIKFSKKKSAPKNKVVYKKNKSTQNQTNKFGSQGNSQKLQV